MEVNIKISEEEINQEVKNILVQKLAEQIFGERNNFDKHGYQRMIKEAVKELLADRVDEVTERAAVYAADYIGKRGVKKIIEKMVEVKE